jgi:YidC/Oxa1 family membrane protein insertase
MDLYRAFLAIVLSFLILLGFQYFFPHPMQQAPPAVPQQTEQKPAPDHQQKSETGLPAPAAVPAVSSGEGLAKIDAKAKDVTIDTPLYTAVITEQGGGFKSFVLKNYRTAMAKDSGAMELIPARQTVDLPALFSLDNGVAAQLPVYTADKHDLRLAGPQDAVKLTMKAAQADGVVIVRTLTFHADSYLIDLEYRVENPGDKPLQVSPALSLANEPFTKGAQSNTFLFFGPAALVNGELIETKGKDLTKGPVVLQGKVSWSGYVDSYFMTSVMPLSGESNSVTLQGSDQHVRTVLSEGIQTLPAQGGQTYTYKLYFGPKKLQILQTANYDLAKAVDFGWFDVLAKPMLWLLNFFHRFSGNYGVAIILLTVLIKLVFWPITQKGMTSMKNMQKLQPKMAKLREKYKDDPARMNQEVMTLYKTYKVNPVGGCLPMLIQIPFFFALYRVLMAAIELRHAPFMLWINDLSAPDRLWVGFDIPYLHGLPIMTLLMGASMYVQQKMTPTTADPAQARIMQFLPIVFTFMFINFASGLVLYWFVNNLLSILQQYLINRQTKAQNS